MNHLQSRLLSVGETVTALAPLPLMPEENWRRTLPDHFFLPQDDVVNSFGQTVLGAPLLAPSYKVQFKTLTAIELKAQIDSVLHSSAMQSQKVDFELDESRVVLVRFMNGSVVVASAQAADAWVGRVEIASRPSRPESLFRNSAVSAALAERLQASAPSELVIRIPRIEKSPLLIVDVESESAFSQSYANISIDLADGAIAEVAVFHGQQPFAHHRITLRVGRDAQLTQLWAQLGRTAAVSGKMLIERKVRLETGARFFDASVFVPSDLLRIMSVVSAEAERASAQCATTVVATGNSVADYEPLQDHVAPRSESHLRAQMIASQRGKAIFQGLINVERDALGTNSSQVNKNLLLSKRARIDSMPKLRILPDEVACKHGSATGEIDAKQVHYLMTRGFTERSAKELVARGFCLEGLKHLNEESPMLAWATQLLNYGLEQALK